MTRAQAVVVTTTARGLVRRHSTAAPATAAGTTVGHKDIGYGRDYQYDPDTTDGFSGADYFPEDMDRETYYRPTRNGYEAQISERLRHWAALRARRRSG